MSSARAERLMFAVSKSSEVSRILPYMVTWLSVQYLYEWCNTTRIENATHWIELRKHSGLYAFIGTTAIQREADNHSRAIDTTGSLSVRSLHRRVQGESECVVLHGRWRNGSKAAATRRPSSDSRLYVVQAFHYRSYPRVSQGWTK